MVGTSDAVATAVARTAPAPDAAGAAREEVLIGFSTPRKWNVLSAIIRKATGSKASHAWLVAPDPLFDLEMVIEAHTTGVRVIPLGRFARSNAIVALVRPTFDLSRGVAAAGRELGDRYDVKGLLGMAGVLLARWLHMKWRGVRHTPHALFCSELVVRALQKADYPGARDLDPEGMSPQDVLEFLQPMPPVPSQRAAGVAAPLAFMALGEAEIDERIAIARAAAKDRHLAATSERREVRDRLRPRPHGAAS